MCYLEVFRGLPGHWVSCDTGNFGGNSVASPACYSCNHACFSWVVTLREGHQPGSYAAITYSEAQQHELVRYPVYRAALLLK
jgi:hypothetical protein